MVRCWVTVSAAPRPPKKDDGAHHKNTVTISTIGRSTQCFTSNFILFQKILDDSLFEHSLSDLHEAGNISALHIVDAAVRLCTELNALLVD